MLPTKYTPQNDFQSLDNAIGVQLDRNFASLAASISSVVDVLTILSRSDSKLANQTVHIHALTDELYKFIQGRSAWNLKGAWQPYRRYEYGDIVQSGSSAYGCCITHGASDVFATDYLAGSWQILTGDNGNTPSLIYVDTADLATRANVLATVASIYESSSHAASTYATNAVLSSLFLSINAAASTYLSIQAAANTYATLTHLDSYAKLNSPALTGLPTAPTPAAGDFSTKIATTEFVASNFDPVGTLVVFTSSGTWTVPVGVRRCKVTVIAGGGGARGYNAFNLSRTDGTTSSFGVYCSATGGAAPGEGFSLVGVGGYGVGGDFNSAGQNGGAGIYSTSSAGQATTGAGDGGLALYAMQYGKGGSVPLRTTNATTYMNLGGGAGGGAVKIIRNLYDGQTIGVTVGTGGIGVTNNTGGIGDGTECGTQGIVIVEY